MVQTGVIQWPPLSGDLLGKEGRFALGQIFTFAEVRIEATRLLEGPWLAADDEAVKLPENPPEEMDIGEHTGDISNKPLMS